MWRLSLWIAALRLAAAMKPVADESADRLKLPETLLEVDASGDLACPEGDLECSIHSMLARTSGPMTEAEIRDSIHKVLAHHSDELSLAEIAADESSVADITDILEDDAPKDAKKGKPKSKPKGESWNVTNKEKFAKRKCRTVRPSKDAQHASEAKAGTPCVFGVDQRELSLLGGCIMDMHWGKNGWCWTKDDMSEWGPCMDCAGSGSASLGTWQNRSEMLRNAKEPASKIWMLLGGGMILGVFTAMVSTFGAWKLRPDLFGKIKDPEGDGVGVGQAFVMNRAHFDDHHWEPHEGEGAPVEACKLSNSATLMNMVTMLIGAGVLAYPALVEECGWCLAPIMIVGGCCLNYVICGILIDLVERVEAKGFAVTEMKHLEKAINGTEILSDASCIAFLFALCAAYLVLMAENMDFIVQGNKKLYILIAGALAGTLALIKDVSVISKLSIVGIIASVLYVICITVAAVTSYQTYEPEYRVNTMGPPTPMKLPTVFCTMLFGFSCQYALPAVRNDMENKGDAKKVFMQAHLLVGSVYLFVGFVGYWGWGTRVAPNVLSSMCESPGCEKPCDRGLAPGCELWRPGTKLWENFEGGPKMAWGKILACAVVSNLIVSIPLCANILYVTMENKYTAIRESWFKNVVCRECLVTCMAVAAILCPFFSEMLGLISAVLVVMLGMILPMFFVLKLDQDEGCPRNYVNVAILVVGVFCLIFGTKGAVEALMVALAQNSGGPDQALSQT